MTNNFDFLRLVFAFTVFLYHCSVLSGGNNFLFLDAMIAVQGFFVISGFLVVKSYENSRSARQYFEKRVRRIYPAYFTIIFLSMVMAIIISDQREYVLTEIFKYLFWNLSFLNFLHPSLSGVFENNANNAINGSLWTLKIEVMFYALVPVLCFFAARFNKLFLFGSLYIISYIYRVSFENHGTDFSLMLARQLPGQLGYFVVGAILYYYLDTFRKYSLFFLLAAIGMVLFQNYSGNDLFRPLVLGIIVIYIACCLPHFGDFAKFGDLSYGVYIIHFPVIQILVERGWFRDSALHTVIVSVVVLFLAFLMWHLVEKKFLLSSSHYRQKEIL